MERSDYPRKSKRNLWLVGLIVLVAALLIYRYSTRQDSDAHRSDNQDKAATPAKVVVNTVRAEDVPLVFEYAGRTAGSREVEIRARVSGILLKRSYVEGERVEQGDVLFRIDPRPFEATLAENQARLTQTKNDWERAQMLYNEKALSAREFDEARAAYEASNALTRSARINLDYTTVTAPISGITSREGLSEGSLVTADNSLLTRLTQIDPIYVNFGAPDSESLLNRQKVASGEYSLPDDGKLTAEIFTSGGVAYPQKASVSFTDSIIDPLTGTVSTRAVLPNKDGMVLPGQFVRVKVHGLTAKNVIVLPDKAVLQGPEGVYVYTLDEGNVATSKIVELGDLNDGKRLITSGLKSGDRVVVEGMVKVKPGMAVHVESPADEPTVADDVQAVPK